MSACSACADLVNHRKVWPVEVLRLELGIPFSVAHGNRGFPLKQRERCPEGRKTDGLCPGEGLSTQEFDRKGLWVEL